MKINLCEVIILVILIDLITFNNGLAVMKGMSYYQPNSQFSNIPNRMMYVQYVQPAPQTFMKGSAQTATSALVAGDAVATQTVIDDCALGAHKLDTADIGPIGTSALDNNTQFKVSAQRPHNVLIPISGDSIGIEYPNEEADTTTREIGSAASNPASVYDGLDTVLERRYEDGLHPSFTKIPTVNTQGSIDVNVTQEEEQHLPAVEPIIQAVPESTNDPKTPRKVISQIATEVLEAAKPSITQTERENVPSDDSLHPTSIAAAIPMTAARRYYSANNSKKVYVELDQSMETKDTLVEEDNVQPVLPLVKFNEDDLREKEDTYVAAHKHSSLPPSKQNCVACARAGAASAKPKPSLPAGTFFPISFDGTSGDAIAIANTFSTGDGGSATSHAIAFGSADAVRTRVRPQYHKRQ